jgi:DNA repair exonuclease SbcCD ATPase subunit
LSLELTIFSIKPLILHKFKQSAVHESLLRSTQGLRFGGREMERAAMIEQGRKKLKAFQQKQHSSSDSPTAVLPSLPSNALPTANQTPQPATPISDNLVKLVQDLSKDKSKLEVELHLLKAQAVDAEALIQRFREDVRAREVVDKELREQLASTKSLLNETLDKNEALLQKMESDGSSMQKLEKDKVELLALLRQKESAAILATVKHTRVQRIELESDGGFDVNSLDNGSKESLTLQESPALEKNMALKEAQAKIQELKNDLARLVAENENSRDLKAQNAALAKELDENKSRNYEMELRIKDLENEALVQEIQRNHATSKASPEETAELTKRLKDALREKSLMLQQVQEMGIVKKNLEEKNASLTAELDETRVVMSRSQAQNET